MTLSIKKGTLGGALLLASSLSVVSIAQEAPRAGGAMSVVVQTEPATFDCHATGLTFTMQTVAPFYSTVLRFDPMDHTKIIGDLAESWSASDDGLTYRFKLRPNVKFHDGSDFDARDVKATFDRLRNPPAGVTSVRKPRFEGITEIQIIDPHTIEFKIASRDSGFLALMANPWNCVYSAAKLAVNPNYPDKEIMGTGPFKFGEYVPGSHLQKVKFESYFLKGQPYLDSIKDVYLKGAGFVNALAGGQVDATFFLLAPPDVERIKSARGDAVTVQQNYISTQGGYTINTKRKPFDDPRVRKAIALSVDRNAGKQALSKITMLSDFDPIAPAASQYALPKARMTALPGYGDDIAKARAEAKKLLAEAGVTNLKVRMLNLALRHPWEPTGVFLMDQLRQIGIESTIQTLEAPAYFAALKERNFDIALDFYNIVTDVPSEIFGKYIPGNPLDYSGLEDPDLKKMIDEAISTPDDTRRRNISHQIIERVIQNANIIPLFWGLRLVTLDSSLKNYKLPPSTAANLDMVSIWKAK